MLSGGTGVRWDRRPVGPASGGTGVPPVRELDRRDAGPTGNGQLQPDWVSERPETDGAGGGRGGHQEVSLHSAGQVLDAEQGGSPTKGEARGRH
jgi:hypothetical protein